MNIDLREIQAGLSQPFAPEDLEWRVQVTVPDKKDPKKTNGLAVPYVTNRAIQNRLDAVVGPENWCNEFKPWHKGEKKESQLCGISIYFEGRGWVTKWDGAEDSSYEPVKGGLSDSMKRAAVHWGVGRILYSMDAVWVEVVQQGKGYAIRSTEQAKLKSRYLQMLEALKLTPAPPGGMQALLVPTEGAAAEPVPQTDALMPSDDAAQPQNPPAQLQAGSKVAQFPPVQEYTHRVLQVKVQSGMTRETTSITLADQAGKKLAAFVNGRRDELQADVLLREVKLTPHVQDNVVFHVLESYTVVPGSQQAA